MHVLFVVWASSGLASASLPGERDLSRYTYEDYVREFAKSTPNHQGAQLAFEANMKTIRAHNADPAKTYFTTVNQFTALTPDEFKATYLGGMLELTDAQHLEEAPAMNHQNLPPSLDWRKRAGVVTYVKDQGSCGSCWAFSTVETLESHYAIALNVSAPILSTQQVTGCTPNPQQCGGTGGCDGNIQSLGFKYTAQAGITGESLYPYQASSSCDTGKIKPCVKNAGFYKVKVNDYSAHMNALVNTGPVAISLAATPMQYYGGGILNKCDCDMNHAVQLVGYGTDKGNDYWLVRNSWGTIWGEKGYIRIQRFGDGKEPTCVDKTPGDGEACKGDTSPRTYAGLCGMLGSSSYPFGLKNVGDCGAPPPPPKQECMWVEDEKTCDGRSDCKWCRGDWNMCFDNGNLPDSCSKDIVV